MLGSVNPGFSVKYEGRAGGDALGTSVDPAPPTAHAFEVKNNEMKLNALKVYVDLFIILIL
jgi:hypothetical protein